MTSGTTLTQSTTVTASPDQPTDTPVVAPLGPVVERRDIKSSLSPFFVLPEYKISYPPVVIRAFEELYHEYNRAFDALVEVNREWETDYQYCLRGSAQSPINFVVQIDMVGLSNDFLETAAYVGTQEVQKKVRRGIFEIENSLAMYQLLEKTFGSNSEDSFFKKEFRAALARLKRRFKKPIALLAVTKQKHEAMRQSEFGKETGEPLTDSEVLELSGFNRLFGPEEFLEYLGAKGGRCEYLLYARTSDPVDKLKKPDLEIAHPLLDNPETRRTIKANSVTINVDDPRWSIADERRINDTKEYMLPMGLGYRARSRLDIITSEFATHLAHKMAYGDYMQTPLSAGFRAYLEALGFESAAVDSGAVVLRCKPMRGTYGCYGHVRGRLQDGEFRNEFQKNIRKRGPYVIQPEMQLPIIINETDGQAYTYIDRNFLTSDGSHCRFMGGFRSLMPLKSTEARNGRNHGNVETVWAEITA